MALFQSVEREDRSDSDAVRRLLEFGRYHPLFLAPICRLMLYCDFHSLRSMDESDHGPGVDTATGRSHRRGSSYHRCHSFRILGDRRSRRIFGQLKCRGGDGCRSEFRDRGERDRIAKAFQGEARIGADAEEHRRLRRLHPRSGAHALFTRANRTEARSLADDDHLRSHRLGHSHSMLSDSSASVSLQASRSILPLQN